MRTKYAVFFTALFAVFSIVANAQSVGIGNVSFTPDASSLLEIRGTGQGLLVPRMAWVNRPGAPGLSVLIFSTDGDGVNGPGYYYWDGANWVKLFAATNANGIYTFENALTETNPNIIRWGGNLTQNTTVSQGGFNTIFDLTGAGDFDIQDAGASKFFVRDDGWVGINTNAPGIQLEVNGNGRFGAVSNGNVTLGNDGNANIELRESDNAGTPFIDISNDNAIDYDARIILNSDDLLSVDGVNVGIPSASASYKLYVNGDPGSGAGYFWGDGGTYVWLADAVWEAVHGYADADDAIQGQTSNQWYWGVRGENSSASNGGGGVYGSGYDGVYGTSSVNDRYSVVGYGSGNETNGVLGLASATASIYSSGLGDGVIGVTDQTGAFGLVGTHYNGTNGGRWGFIGNSAHGSYGSTDVATGYGIYGVNTNASGTGTVGAGNNIGLVYLTPGSGGAFTGSRFGAFDSHLAFTAAGSGYRWQLIATSGTIGYSPWSGRQGSNWDPYQFGMVGQKEENYAGSNYYDRRSGGVLGSLYRTDNTTVLGWGSLGYMSSGTVSYGVYGSAAYASGAGFMAEPGIIEGIGAGFNGGVMGAWIKGEVLGMTSMGDVYAAYNIGDVYTTGLSANLIKTENDVKSVYAVTATDVKVYADGKARLSGGQCFVKFNSDFTAVIDKSALPTITVTPSGECKGLYISECTAEGFTVKELGSGTSNVEFNWISVANRVDHPSKPQLPEIIADKGFEQNLKQVMFNENNLERSAKPIWFDGKLIRFDQPVKTTANASKQPLDGATQLMQGQKVQQPIQQTEKPYQEPDKKSK
jgi:hypothetical protein